MTRPLLTFLLTFFVSLCTHSQEQQYTVANNNFLKFAADKRFDGCQFNILPYNTVYVIDFRPSGLVKNGQYIFNLNGSLLINLASTGFVYRATPEAESDSVVFYRLDKTKHIDYNINAYPFVYKNKLYNIGGYGFWHWSGHLRQFNEKQREWDIVPLNIEVPLSYGPPGYQFWISQKENVLYTFGYVRGNEAIKDSRVNVISSIDTIMKLDLKTSDWTVIGKQNKKIAQSLQTAYLTVNLDSGLLINNQGQIQYLNLLSNKIYSLNNRESSQALKSQMSETITWFKNDKLYYADHKMAKVDSISLSTYDFTPINEKVFTNKKQLSSSIGIFIAIIATGVLIYYTTSNGAKNFRYFTKKSSQIDLVSPYAGKDVFDEVEKALVRLLIENMSIRNCRTATDDVNRILGVGSKSSDMQKRKRSDVIRSINAKYKILMPNTNIQLVDRVKNDGDGRLYEYFIAESEVSILKDYIA